MAARKTGVVHAGYLKTRVIRGANDGGARIVGAAAAAVAAVAAVVVVVVIVDVATIMRWRRAARCVMMVREIISGMGGSRKAVSKVIAVRGARNGGRCAGGF